MKYEWFVASRYLRSRRKQSFISIISIISVGGVALGIATVILVISVMNGFESGLKEKFLANEAHVIVRSTEDYFINYQEKLEEIEAIEGVVSASPVIYSQLAIQPRNSEVIKDTIYVKGIAPRWEDRVTGFSGFVPGFTDFQHSILIEEAQRRVAGRETITGGIVLGYYIAKRMSVVPGDVLRLISKMVPDPVHPGSFLPHIRNFVVIGLYQSGMYTYDNAFGFIDLEIAQKLYNKKDQVNMIEVRTVNANMAATVQDRIQTQIRFNQEGFASAPITTTWMDSRAPLFDAMKLEKMVTVIIEALIILVASFNIASTLIMMVMEKTRDIGILRALGASKPEVRKIFMIQGSIIGVLGAIFGTVLGVLICWLLDFQVVRPSRWFALLILLPIGIQGFLAFQRTLSLHVSLKGALVFFWLGAVGLFLYCLAQPIYIDSQVYQLNRLPVKISWFFVVFMNILSFVICWFATLYPAWQASNLNPIEALRYE